MGLHLWRQVGGLLNEDPVEVLKLGKPSENQGPDAARKFAQGRERPQNGLVQANWNKLQELALDEVEKTLAELPQPLREQAQKLPVTFEHVPNAGLQADGIEADTLGLFTGSEFADSGAELLPPQIILFLENLWDFAEGREEAYREEVRTTFLHELGHFLGLGEDDLTERGLD
jgi:predicted Zn-dependent protease with MMP-like domain